MAQFVNYFSLAPLFTPSSTKHSSPLAEVGFRLGIQHNENEKNVNVGMRMCTKQSRD